MSLFREPDAGNLPVRFDEREQETEPSQTGLRWRGESQANYPPGDYSYCACSRLYSPLHSLTRILANKWRKLVKSPGFASYRALAFRVMQKERPPRHRAARFFALSWQTLFHAVSGLCRAGRLNTVCNTACTCDKASGRELRAHSTSVPLKLPVTVVPKKTAKEPSSRCIPLRHWRLLSYWQTMLVRRRGVPRHTRRRALARR